MYKTTKATSANNAANGENKAQSGKLLIGTTLYTINVHFGKLQLEEILKNRILSTTKTA